MILKYSYADPENYFQRVSEKSDVYSYGIVLLELITGRKTKVESTDIVTWVRIFVLIVRYLLKFISSFKFSNYIQFLYM